MNFENMFESLWSSSGVSIDHDILSLNHLSSYNLNKYWNIAVHNISLICNRYTEIYSFDSL